MKAYRIIMISLKWVFLTSILFYINPLIAQEDSIKENTFVTDSTNEDSLQQDQKQLREELLQSERERIELEIEGQRKAQKRQMKIFYIAAICLALFVTSFVVLILINRRLRKKAQKSSKRI